MAKNRRRKPVQTRQTLHKWLQGLLRITMFSVSIGLLAGISWGVKTAYQRMDVPVKEIVIEGKFERISQAELQQVIQPMVMGGIISLDLVAVRDQLDSHPWVSASRVSRHWPNGVRIFIEEEVPIARWNAGGFLNSRGQLMEIDDNSGLAELPQLTGPSGEQMAVMTRYREVAELIQTANLGIASMAMDRRGVLQLSLKNGIAIQLGKDNVLEKMRRMLVVWNAGLATRQQQIDTLDLRYTNGIAVDWHTQHKAVATHGGAQLEQQFTTFSEQPVRVMRPING